MRRLLVRRVLVLGGVLVAVCLLRVWLSLQVVNVGYQLSAMRKVQEKLEAEQRNLAAQLAHLRGPGLLGDVARGELGMVEPRRGQLVEIDR
jgi:cell division protein FtsB